MASPNVVVTVGSSENPHPIDNELYNIEHELPPWYYNLLSYFLGLIFFPITFFGGWLTLQPNEEGIVTLYGRYRTRLIEPGIYFFCPFGNVIQKVNTALCACQITKEKVLDSDGAPLLVSAIVTYHIEDSVKATFQVHAINNFIMSQSLTALKHVAALYPYDAESSSSMKAPPPSLRHDSGDIIKNELCSQLQRRVAVAGISVKRFELVDLSFAPEVAKIMLARQEAQATLAARQIIVEGAVGIVQETLIQLRHKTPDKRLNKEELSKLACNIVTVIVGRSISEHTMVTST